MVPRVLVLLATLAALTPAVTGAPDASEDCAPPCLWVYPQIELEVALTPEERAASNLEDLPAVVDVHVRYRWDLQEDGTGIPGPNPSEIHLRLPTVPYWLQAELSTDSCPFQPLPHQPDQEVCTVQLHLATIGIPHSAAALQAGDRLLVVAMSDETGTYKQGYGVSDQRFHWDGTQTAPATAVPEPAHTGASDPLLWTGFALLVSAAAAALLIRHRRHRQR